MKIHTLAMSALTAFFAMVIATTANAASAPTLELQCSFKTPNPQEVSGANLVLNFAKMTASSDLNVLNIAVLGREFHFNKVDSFRKVGNAFELAVSSVASGRTGKGTVTLQFSETELLALINGASTKVPVAVTQTSSEVGPLASRLPCQLSVREMFTKDANQDAAVDPFVKSVNIPNKSDASYPIWKELSTPNLRIFCVISPAQRSNGVQWPTREYCNFKARTIIAPDGASYFRHIVGAEAQAVYNALPGHRVMFTGVTVARPTPESVREVMITCDSPNHCLIQMR